MFQCSECVKQYTQKKSLYKHIRTDHNPDYKPEKKTYTCAECGKSFSNKFKLVCHIKEHGASRNRRQKIRCSLCSHSFPRYKQFDDHLNSAHGILVNRKALTFQNNQAFSEWKENIQSSSGIHYIKERATQSTLRDGKVDYYRCHRSYDPNIKAGQRTKYLGSNKIGAACPSRITVQRLRDVIIVNYVDTHVGHDCDVRRVPLTLSEKMTIVGKLKQGVTFYRVLEDIRRAAKNEDVIQRIHLVNTKTLHDICREFNINSKQRHSNDSITRVTSDQGNTDKIDKISNSSLSNSKIFPPNFTQLSKESLVSTRSVNLENKLIEKEKICNEKEKPYVADLLKQTKELEKALAQAEECKKKLACCKEEKEQLEFYQRQEVSKMKELLLTKEKENDANVIALKEALVLIDSLKQEVSRLTPLEQQVNNCQDSDQTQAQKQLKELTAKIEVLSNENEALRISNEESRPLSDESLC